MSIGTQHKKVKNLLRKPLGLKLFLEIAFPTQRPVCCKDNQAHRRAGKKGDLEKQEA